MFFSTTFGYHFTLEKSPGPLWLFCYSTFFSHTEGERIKENACRACHAGQLRMVSGGYWSWHVTGRVFRILVGALGPYRRFRKSRQSSVAVPLIPRGPFEDPPKLQEDSRVHPPPPHTLEQHRLQNSF